MNRTFVTILPRALVALVFLLPLFALAAGSDGFVPLADVSKSSKLSSLYTSSGGDLSVFVNSLFKFALAAGALAAVLRLTYAGYLYMGQADMWSHKGQAKEIIGDVTLGLLLLLGIWLILNQINPDILKLNALRNITPAQRPTSSGTPAAPAQVQPASLPSDSIFNTVP